MILFCFISYAGSEELHIPVPTGYVVPSDPELKDLRWHKWQTSNFVILSIDRNQGDYLNSNVESMKAWVLSRWAFPDVKFTAESKICCVPNRALMKKLFGLDQSYSEVRRDQSGRIILTAMWLILEGSPGEVIPPSITTICLSEFEQTHSAKMGYWVHRGMTLLNSTLPQIRTKLSGLKLSTNSQNIISTTEKQWKDMDVSARDRFDTESAALLLLFRKEMGQSNLIGFLQTSGTEQDVNKIFGYAGFNELDAVYRRYCDNLGVDIASNRTPNDYLLITPVMRK